MSSSSVVDEELSAGRRAAGWRAILLWVALGGLALLAAMTLLGLAVSAHSRSEHYRPPVPRPAITGDMPR